MKNCVVFLNNEFMIIIWRSTFYCTIVTQLCVCVGWVWRTPALTERMFSLCCFLSWETPNPAWRCVCVCSGWAFWSVCVILCLMNLCVNVQVAGVTALACGMIAVGSCNGDVTSTILQTIMEKNEQELKDTYARWLPLGLGLNHLGKNGFRLCHIKLTLMRITN